MSHQPIVGGIVGGFGHEEPASDHVKALVNQLKDQILAKLGLAAGQEIKVSTASHQVVAGSIYNVKVEIAGKHYKIKVVEPLPHSGQPVHVLEAHAA